MTEQRTPELRLPAWLQIDVTVIVMALAIIGAVLWIAP